MQARFVLGNLPDAPGTGIRIAVAEQETNQDFMRSPADRIEFGLGEIVGITNIERIGNVDTQHSLVTFIYPNTSAHPEQVMVLQFQVNVNLRVVR